MGLEDRKLADYTRMRQLHPSAEQHSSSTPERSERGVSREVSREAILALLEPDVLLFGKERLHQLPIR